MEFYFAKFPNIIYNDLECKDISRRVKVTTDFVGQPTLFYPYVIETDIRADQLAQFHFEDSYGDWMLYLTNGIIDPYYGWYLDDNQFESLINEKYGSFENSVKRIKNYRMNWYNVDAEIPVNIYENVIPENHKKYYMPIFGQKTKILSYKRRDSDWYLSTNQIIKLDITYNSNNIFTVGELVDIKTGVNVNSNSGVEVISSNSSSVILKNITGDFSVNNFVIGETSQANATINDLTYLANNIAINERTFWEPVTFYDYEREKNEKNKNLYLLNADSYLDVAEDFRIKLQTDTF
jgi:hypothetical protein